MERRHETFLRVKSAESSDGERWITAWASTPDEDLAGDIVSPTGAKYQLPIPLLAFHKTDSPVGVVTEAHVSDKGIRVRAKLTKGVALADEVWALVKDGAIGAVSIGFKALKSKPLKSGGLLFEAWRWLELSLTPVPCNSNARIISVGKSIAYATGEEAAQLVPVASPEDWKAQAKAKGAELVQKAATGGGSPIEIVGKLAMQMHMHFAEELNRLTERVDSVAARGLKYAGVYQRALDYERGDVVTHKGSAWIALRDAATEPGDTPEWQLMVKRGRDA